MLSVCFILLYVSETKSYGYDSSPDQGACKRYRSSRLLQPPCDLAVNTFCTTAGTMYPWHAVRRFVRENQGLMKRMYGDLQHISVLRSELESNEIESSAYYSHLDDDLYMNGGNLKSRYAKDVEFDNELHQNDEYTPRLLQDESKIDDILNTKFIYSEEPTKSIKLGDLRTVPNIRTTTEKTIETNTVTSSTSAKVSESNTTEIFYEIYENQTVTENTTDKTTITTTTEPTTDTTTSLDETTTEGLKKKETVGTVLFQDVVSQKEKLHPSMNYKTQGVNACPVKQEMVAPFWANNTRGELLALLNIYPYEQYMHWEICTYEHRQMYCRDGCKCEQQYRVHRLLAYDPNNECKGIFADWFKFPSCCVCKCYDIPEFRVTSRSPRNKDEKYVPNWFKKKTKVYYN